MPNKVVIKIPQTHAMVTITSYVRESKMQGLESPDDDAYPTHWIALRLDGETYLYMLAFLCSTQIGQ